MNTPPHPWSRDLSLMLAWGEDKQAEHLLEQLNKVQRGFGLPDYTMPEPLDADRSNLEILADEALAELRLTEVVTGDPFLRRVA